MKDWLKKGVTYKNILFVFFVLLTSVMFIKQEMNYKTIMDSLQKKDSVKVILCDTNCVKEVVLPSNFNYTFTRFLAYNPSIDSSTVKKFLEVADEFGLNNDIETLRWSIGQILLESGGKQYYEKGHRKEGQLVLSNTGAIGFCQILGSTALDFMVRKIKDDDKARLCDLGATDFSFAYDKRYTKREKIKMAKEWLAVETNNIIMWGYIMRNNLNVKKNMISALISYNVGIGGLNLFLKGGNKGYEHAYIKGIRHRINYVERRVNALAS